MINPMRSILNTKHTFINIFMNFVGFQAYFLKKLNCGEYNVEQKLLTPFNYILDSVNRKKDTINGVIIGELSKCSYWV